MTAAMSELPPAGGWTTDDLDALPDDGLRRELLDGVLLVPPSPAHDHGEISGLLYAALHRSRTSEFRVTQTVEVRISRSRSFIPDLLAVSAVAAARNPSKYPAHEVMLAIEIVSPTSQIMDRVTKPALYATAGIPYFWRIETDGGIVVHTYKIDPEAEVYRLTGTFTEEIVLDEPWKIRIPVADITP